METFSFCCLKVNGLITWRGRGGKRVSGGGVYTWKFTVCFQNSDVIFNFATFAYNVHCRKGAQIQEPVGQQESN